jgi:hypothetical protein
VEEALLEFVIVNREEVLLAGPSVALHATDPELYRLLVHVAVSERKEVSPPHTQTRSRANPSLQLATQLALQPGLILV